MAGLRHYQSQTNYTLKINIISGMAPHMVGLGGVNWSSTWGSVLGCWGHNGDLYLLCFKGSSRCKKKNNDKKKQTYPQIHGTKRCWRLSSFFRLPTVCGSPTSPSLMARSLFLKFEEQNFLWEKNLNPGSLAWVASDLQRHLPWLRLHQGPPLEITRLSQNIQVTLCYLGRVMFTLNWKLW